MSNLTRWDAMKRPPVTALKTIKAGRLAGMSDAKNAGWQNVIQKPLNERFWMNVAVKGKDECWIWLGALNVYGYGKLRDNYKTVRAHRVSYVLNVGAIPEGMHVLHKCDVRNCVNPSHLFVGTQSDNNKDMFSKGRNRNQFKSGEYYGK